MDGLCVNRVMQQKNQPDVAAINFVREPKLVHAKKTKNVEALIEQLKVAATLVAIDDREAERVAEFAVLNLGRQEMTCG